MIVSVIKGIIVIIYNYIISKYLLALALVDATLEVALSLLNYVVVAFAFCL